MDDADYHLFARTQRIQAQQDTSAGTISRTTGRNNSAEQLGGTTVAERPAQQSSYLSIVCNASSDTTASSTVNGSNLT
ncbi:MAG: hypothetical protein ACI91B_001670, partial [Planctomycetota bacterium]